MARVEHLEIYKTSYNLLVTIIQVIRQFPKDFKFSLGNSLKTECIELVMDIYRANSTFKNRSEIIDRIIERINVIQLVIRLSKDLHFINVKKFSELANITDSIARQANGWNKFSKQTYGPE